MAGEKADMDRGWAWVVVLGGVLLFIVLGGTERGFGFLYVELLDRYHGTAATTAWVGGIATSLRFFMGPLATALAVRFSYRTIVIAGGVVRALGFIISGYAPTVESLWLTYGVLVGIGGGLVYTNTLVIVAIYFNKKRALATGMCMAGAGIGTLTYSYLYPALLQEFGYQGTMLIIGGLTFNICVAGFVYRTPKDIPGVHIKDVTGMKDREEEIGLQEKDVGSVEGGVNLDSSAGKLKMNQVQDVTGSAGSRINVISDALEVDVEGKDSMVISSHKHQNGHSADLPVSVKLLSNENSDSEKTDSNNRAKHDRLAGFRKVFDYTLLGKLSFVLFAASITVGTITTIVTVMFIPAMGQEHGIDKLGTSTLISAIGFTDIFARVLLGAMYDTPFVRPRRQLVYSGIYLFCGLVAISFAFVRNFVVFTIVAVLFGLSSSSVITQRSVVLADLIGIERLSTGAGLCSFFQGIGIMIGPLIGGMLKDYYNTYAVCFYFTGSCAVFGSSLLFFEYWFRTHKRTVKESR